MEIELPSKSKLFINMAPFAESKELYQTALEELKSLKIDPNAEIDTNFLKDIFCTGFSSKKLDAALWKCIRRCTYNKQVITEDSFEKVEAREDYMQICFLVLEANIKPFTKTLSQQLKQLIEKVNTFHA